MCGRDDQIDLLRMVEDDHVDRVAQLEKRIERIESQQLAITERLARLTRGSEVDNLIHGGTDEGLPPVYETDV